MPRLLLNLRNVPDDEADEVRALMRDNRIEIYETPANRWGISAAGIWVRDDEDWPRARRLMDDYQLERRTRVREALAEARRDGSAETFWSLLRARPLQVLGILAAVVFIAALSALPFLLLR
ncbi:DUF6164 family protein [Coralloluteibacterium thermophilus]|uniref:DUF6164 family protein n=1 Tax=Coralloluteibacterium thermophilum TaxID=2707049 RepID=A0ABV9NL00_9GAMM